ncbi:hypothetical protein BDQ12DRAFT_675493 [Crucibulum laeve]|uniref:F-box domain-containing protein n=1 Tax=Crucibulum laeve TaxID=68775 RepID=A0A5C3MFP6_9AGAR|nr:hypothetical protein BDQ12DRAFT_675493 [Crucibulum laeve]
MLFESLPVELIAEILGELDLESLIKLSYLSKRLYLVASDTSLNPWRRPILRNLSSHLYEPSFKHLCVRTIVPRQNWIEILSLAKPAYILFEATLPNLKSVEWEECFKRRFLPGWQKWKKDCTWKEIYLKILYRLWHRSVSSCTADEAWTKYIVLNRNGSANELEMSSRNFNPFTVFNEMKLQNNLAHLETRIRLVVEFADVRILAFGTLGRPQSTLTVNTNARIFLHPPGIEAGEALRDRERPAQLNNFVEDHGVYPLAEEGSVPSYLSNEYHMPYTTYTHLSYPLPAPTHANYPFYTPGGGDRRWVSSEAAEEEGLHWVGGMMIIAQILNSPAHEAATVGTQYASFTWSDLWKIAPWLDERIAKRIDGPGLGND